MKKTQKVDYDVLKSIVDCMYEAVCVVDHKGKVMIWNKSAEKLYGVTYEEIAGQDVKSFFQNPIVDQVRETHIPVTNKNHTPRANAHILANSTPLYVHGKFCGAVSTDRDFDEVLRLYSELDKAHSKVLFLESEMKKITGVFGDVIGESAGIRKKINMARQIASTDTSVMITGESGTGKEVFARGIHDLSARKGLFIPVNCSAIPAELFESEFFGYCSGAFTGASKNGKVGILELANEGTIFLDEIGDMPLHMQAKLLRVLQEREIIRVGGERTIKLDIRIISATHQDLKARVKEGKFREDLYYRINVVELHLPPLRERKEDLPLFLNHFLQKFSIKCKKTVTSMETSAVNILMNYNWPGNIREFMNVVEHAVAVSSGDIIKLHELPEYMAYEAGGASVNETYPLDLGKAIKKLEIKSIQKALELSNNNKSKASRLLNMPRGTLYHKLEEYKIQN